MVKESRAKVENTIQSSVQKINTRPPVVAILGHVDHGKTTLLDYIRKSHVVEKEAGGITQHIGSYQIVHKDRTITFIDTPGHEAFSTMRARGGAVSDLALLVIAADDGVMPQTRESIAHIKAAGIPFIVVINKIDLPQVNIEKIKKQLADCEILVEGFGGDVVVAEVSAKTGQGVDDLIDMTILVSDLQELKDTSHNPFSGVIIESSLDRFKGPVALILVKEGYLHIGDTIYTSSTSGKVKSLLNTDGKQISYASPSTPAEVLGFSSVPEVGVKVSVNKGKSSIDLDKKEMASPTDFSKRITKLKESEVRLIIKADVSGTLEAIINSIKNLKQDEYKLEIYYSGTGNVTESDVLLAAATKSIIIGFNVTVGTSAERLAIEEKTPIRKYTLIYELLDELKEGMEALSEKKQEATILGEAMIIKIFNIENTKIAGCVVKEGRINKNDLLVVKRNGKEIGRSKITSIKQRDTDLNEAIQNEEFGVVLEKSIPFTKGDIMSAIG